MECICRRVPLQLALLPACSSPLGQRNTPISIQATNISSKHVVCVIYSELTDESKILQTFWSVI